MADPEMIKLGVLYSGRTLYGCTIRGEYAYAATHDKSPQWDELTWWAKDTEWVQKWLTQLRQQSKEGKEWFNALLSKD